MQGPFSSVNQNKIQMKTIELRYAGDYSGSELYGRYKDVETAKAAWVSAMRTARAWGNAKLASSFYLC